MPAFAEAPALRKALRGGRQMSMNVKVQNLKIVFPLNFGLDLKFELWYLTFELSGLFYQRADLTG